jgi:hypothetical protein
LFFISNSSISQKWLDKQVADMKVIMSKARSIGILILFSTIVLSGAVFPASADFITPNRFSGDVILNGTDAPIGTIIEAFIGGDSRGNIAIESQGKYEYLPVNGSASDDGMSVTFIVNGLSASTDRSAIWTAWIDKVQIINLVAGDAPAGDITPPDITITEPKSDASFTTATITVSGTASDESLDKVKVKVGSDGDWVDVSGTLTSWSTTVALNLGPNTIYARAIDTTGNPREVQVDDVSYVVGGSEDTTPPTISIDSPSDGDAFTTKTTTVSGTASDNEGVSKVEVKVGSGDWMDATGTTSWSKTMTLGQGLNTINVRAIDTTGNPSETSSITVAYNPPSSGGSTNGGLVVTQGATPTGTDAQPVSGETVTSTTPTPTTTGTVAPATTSAKEESGAEPEEKKGLIPGFEAMFAIAGLLAVTYLIRNRV